MSMMATITKQSMEGKGPLSFDQILSDPVNLNYFKNFCEPPVHTSCLTYSLASDSRPRWCRPMPRFPPAAVGPRRFGRPWPRGRLG